MSKVIEFPHDRTLGYLHVKSADLEPPHFHGRYKLEGGVFDDISNPNWKLIGEARTRVEVLESDFVLLEILPEEARDLSPLATLAPDALSALWLGNTHVDDDQLRHLSRLTELRWIDIQNNGAITDRGIEHLRGLTSLEHFGAHWTRIGDASIEALSRVQTLTYLDIWGCEVSEEALKKFRLARPGCHIQQ